MVRSTIGVKGNGEQAARGRSVVRREVLQHGLLGLATLAGCDAGDDPVGRPMAPKPLDPARLAANRRKADAGAHEEEAGARDAQTETPPDSSTGRDSGPDSGDSGRDSDRDSGRDSGSDSGRPRLVSNLARIGPLGAPDENGVRLPPGFTCRIVAMTGKPPVAGRGFLWHVAPDGGAVYPAADGGHVYVSNCEAIPGGAGALRFNALGELVAAYSILWGTRQNCAGGATPWGTWLSCEEVRDGVVIECDPFGIALPTPRPALGRFTHEAVAVDPLEQRLYLTEDCTDGRLYRFTPSSVRDGVYDLSRGTLAVAQVAKSGEVTWHALPDPEFTSGKDTRYQIPDSTPFNGGEGIVYFNGVVFVSTKGDNRIWSYDTKARTMKVFYERASSPTPMLSGVDNLTVTSEGDVLVAEDLGDMEVVAILEDGSLRALLQVTGQESSEITGLAFDPSGTRLYFSSQRGTGANGITYEVTGPFHVPRTR